ncbi:MAG: potassium channel family protein [Acidimicrobiales bacterium]
MHVVVVGCGRVGSGLARALESGGHTVGIIDRKPHAFVRLPDDFKGRKVVGVGFDRDRLAEAGIDEAGAVAAVTNGDNSNITVARVAKETYRVERVVARIYDPRRAAIYERLGIPTIATVQWTTERVLRRILPDTPAVEWTDASARLCLVERTLPASWAGHDLSELDRPKAARLAGVARLGVAQVPDPKLVAQEGDVLYVAVASDHLDEFDAVLAAGPGGRH